MGSRVDPITGLIGFLFGFFTIESGTDKLSRNVGKKISTIRCVITQKNAVLLYSPAWMKLRKRKSVPILAIEL
jgi:hypothetical protein